MPFKKGKLNYSYTHKSWNEGLTKETDERLRKISEDRVGENNPNWGNFINLPRICLVCGKKFRGREKRKYCSNKCRGISQIKPPNKKCSICGKEFRGRKGKKYCSKECQWEAMRGRKRSLESRLKQSKTRTGKYRKEKAPNWKGGVQRGKPKGDWRHYNWRKKVFTRDDYTCQECGDKGVYLEAHHIKQWRYYTKLRYRANNGITLCRDCHNKTKFKEKMLEKYYTKLLREGRKVVG